MPRPRTLFMTMLFGALALLALYALVLALLWWGQEKLLFHPDKLAPEHDFKQAADVHETWVDVPGARLNALHLKLPNPRGVVFFLHGNAGSLQSWFVNVGFYRRANFDLYMFDYRGFGKSTGHIESQAQMEADVRAAWAHVAALYPGKPLVVYGRSLGTGLATTLAAEVAPALTILVSPYSSMVAVAQEHYPWVPQALLRYPLRTEAALPSVRGPVLLVHGGLDTLIPPAHSQRLHAVAPQAQLLLVPQGGHGDIHEFPLYLDSLAAALAKL